MGNLIQSRFVCCINEPDQLELGAYVAPFTDPAGLFTNLFHLVLKKYGIDVKIEGINAYFALDTLPVRYSCPQEGYYKGLMLELNPECPCEECDYEYGVTVKEVLNKPGVMKPVYGRSRFYGGVVNKIECTDGLIDDEYLLRMEDEIIEQVHADEDAWVYCTRSYIITDTVGTASTYTITDADGVETAITDGGAHTAQEMVDAFLAEGYTAYIVGTEGATVKIMVNMGYGNVSTLAATAGGAIFSRRLSFVNRTVDVSYNVTYDTGFATPYYGWMFVVSSSDAYVVADIALTINNVGYAIDTGTDQATFISDVETATATLVKLTDLGDYTAICNNMDLDVDQLNVALAKCDWETPLTTNLSLVNAATPEGKWPYMPAADIQSLFANEGHHGRLHFVNTPEKPVPGVDYCKITIRCDSRVYSQHGAGHDDTFIKWLDIFVPASYFCSTTNVFDASELMSDDPTTPDMTLKEFFDYIGGVGP